MFRKLHSILFLFILALALANLVVTNAYAGRGRIVTDLEEEIALLQHQNLKLELQIAQTASLTQLSQRLDEDEFQTPRQITVVRSVVPVAMR